MPFVDTNSVSLRYRRSRAATWVLFPIFVKYYRIDQMSSAEAAFGRRGAATSGRILRSGQRAVSES